MRHLLAHIFQYGSVSRAKYAKINQLIFEKAKNSKNEFTRHRLFLSVYKLIYTAYIYTVHIYLYILYALKGHRLGYMLVI